MSSGLQAQRDAHLRDITARLDLAAVESQYWEQDEFVFLEGVFSPALVSELVDELQVARRESYRSWIPGLRKAGTIGWSTIQRHAPNMAAIYRSPEMLAISRRLSKKGLVLKARRDEHACATYVYDRPGDAIGWHYDTCGCELGTSHAVIISLVNNSQSRFLADLHKRTQGKPVSRVEHSTTPGSMLLFCGDNVWHATSPLERGEERIVMCLSYVVRGKHIRGFERFTENFRDAAFYFGLRAFKQRNDEA